jgi:neutral ceramidase
MSWKAGIAKAVITPDTPVWLSGYGTKRAPEGKIHDLWVKVLALEDPHGNRVVLVTTDHMGIPKGMYESMVAEAEARLGLARSQVMFTFSHNHCGPRLRGDLVDYYPIDEEQTRLVAAYTDSVAEVMLEAAARAIDDLRPASLAYSEGTSTFAVNRRENTEDEVVRMREAGQALKGVVDHYVPVLTVHGEKDELRAVLFGYACHPTTLSFTQWCGDYPGFAQIDIEQNHPGTTAMFFNACGADQNPIPRRTVELCRKYGGMLARSVEEVLASPLKPVGPGLNTAFEFVDLAYQSVMTREELNESTKSDNAIHARWAKRMLARLDAGGTFASSYPFPVQAWKLGKEILFIGIGGESVVDYSLNLKKTFGPGTWVCGYANDQIAYIPSRRVWEEGGYEGGPHLDEYGHPAMRWAGDVEERILTTVNKVVDSLGD